jgi:hypothetical protein
MTALARYPTRDEPPVAELIVIDTPEIHEGDPLQAWAWVDRDEAPSGLQPKDK